MIAYFAGAVTFTTTDILLIFFAIALPWTMIALSIILGYRDFKRKRLSVEAKVCFAITLVVLALPILSGAF